jgi:alpha-N-arabinofuranosidase
MITFAGNPISNAGQALGKPPTYAAPTAGSASVVIDHATVINAKAGRMGINANYWEDAQSRRDAGAAPRRAGYEALRATFVRWPGGHKADGVTWFLDADGNATSTPTPRLCRFGSGEWPATDASFWTPVNDYTGHFSRDLYGLQDFLDDCLAVQATPVIVVALDTINNPPAGAGAWGITKAQAITNAVEMVRWCNVTNNYGVKYWELGNESWSNSTGYTGGFPGHPEGYGAAFAEMAAAMKAIDPAILVGLNGNADTTWFGAAIAAAGPANVDFLVVHRYPEFGMTYAQYQASSMNALHEATLAQNTINTLSPADQARIFIMMTETGYTSQPNNMGAAVIIAHALGAQLSTPNVRATFVWNTRYAPYGSSHDMLDTLNKVTPAGQGQALAAMLCPGKIVSATSTTTDVYAFASYDDTQGRTAVLLINRASTAQAITVAAAGVTVGTAYQLCGTGPADTVPTITAKSIPITDGITRSLTVPAASVTLLEMHQLRVVPEALDNPPIVTTSATYSGYVLAEAATTLGPSALITSVMADTSTGALNTNAFQILGSKTAQANPSFGATSARSLKLASDAVNGSPTSSPYNVSFIVNGSACELIMGASSGKYRLEVDGRRVTKRAVLGPTYSSGGVNLVRLDFGNARTRRITFIATAVQTFLGVITRAGDIPTAPTLAVGKRFMVLGDSYADGTSSSCWTMDTYWWSLASMLGFRDIGGSTMAGTGYVNDNGTFTSTGKNYQDRVADIVNRHPDVVLVQSSLYDTLNSITTTVAVSAANATWTALRTGLPSAKIISTGLLYPRSSYPSNGLQQALNDALRQAGPAAVTAGTLDYYIDAHSGDGAEWFTSDSDSRYLASDFTHPNQDGHDYLAARFAEVLGPLIHG